MADGEWLMADGRSRLAKSEKGGRGFPRPPFLCYDSGMNKKLLAAFAATLSIAAAAAITPAQIPAGATGLAVMDPRAVYASPFWSAIDKSLTPVQKQSLYRHGFADGTLSSLTVCKTSSGSGVFLETAQDADTLITKGWNLSKEAAIVPCTIHGRKAYRCDFSQSAKTVTTDPKVLASARDGIVFIVTGPRSLLLVVPEDAKGAKPDFEKLAAPFLDPKAPKMAPASKLAKFLTLPAGLWVYGAFTGLDKELKSAAGDDPQAAAMNPMSGFSGIKSVTVKLGPGQAPASAALSLRASCADEQSAAGVVGLTTMMKGMLAMGGANGKSSMPPELISFINGIAITQDGKRINVATEVSAAIVKALVDAQAKAATAPKHAAPASSSSAPADVDL